MKSLALLAVISALLTLPAVFAIGYGTSTISLSNNNITLIQGGNATLSFNVNLSTGNTWGTTVVVQNSAQLSKDGISISISNAQGDPPYSGTLLITALPSAQKGKYQAVFGAIGDDPSTNSAVLNITIGQTSSIQPVTTLNTTASNTIAKTTATTTIASTKSSGSGSSGYVSSGYGIGSYGLIIAFIIVIALISAYLVYKMKRASTRAIVIGVALIIIGISVWLYGDYNGGIMLYIWSGVVSILIGTAIWIYGDYIAGAFRSPKK